MNQLSGMTVPEIQDIIDDPKTPAAKLVAANRLMCAMERPDLGQFAKYLAGEETLAEVKARGIDTAIIKRAKIGAKGERELELHDRGLADSGFVTHETDGLPTQHVTSEQTIHANVAFSFAPIPEGD